MGFLLGGKMQKVKVISGCAAFGFILSFLFGLLSHSKFYIILIKALVFAVIFGIIGLLITFLFSKFLDDESSGEFGSNDDSASDSNAKKGANLVVVDQEFERGDGDNHFAVGDKHQMLNDTDLDKGSNESKETIVSDNDKYVPIKKVETVDNISGTEAVSSVTSTSNTGFTAAAPVRSSGDSADGLDTLPDMGDFAYGTRQEVSVSRDDDSNTSFSTSSSISKSSDNTPEIQDSALIAKAISSVLSNEEEL